MIFNLRRYQASIPWDAVHEVASEHYVLANTRHGNEPFICNDRIIDVAVHSALVWSTRKKDEKQRK